MLFFPLLISSDTVLYRREKITLSQVSAEVKSGKVVFWEFLYNCSELVSFTDEIKTVIIEDQMKGLITLWLT